MNSFRIIVASLAGIVLVVAIAVAASMMSNGRSSETRAATADNRAPDRSAPSASNNPMAPVVPEEASRRSELHGRFAEEQAQAAASSGKARVAYIAPPVVTEVRKSNNDDALTRAIFEDQMPEPEPEPAQVVEVAPEVSVEVAPEVSKAPETPKAPGYMDYYGQYKDRLRINLMDNTPAPRVIRVYEKQSNLFLDILNAVGSAFVSTAHAGGLEEPVWETVIRPNVYGDVPVYGNGYNLGATALYGSPNANERSAARPALVGIDSLGRGYGTQEFWDTERRLRQSGRTVLARSGDLVYARLMYGFNSDDIRGLPIYAIITDVLDSGEEGPLHGARIEGRVAYSRDNASISFNRIILPDGRDIPMAGIAISADAARTGVAAKVNKHRLWNLGTMFLAGMMEGASDVVTSRLKSSGNAITIITGDGSSSTSSGGRDTLTDRELLAGALGPVGRNITRQIERTGGLAPTMTAPAGHIFGLVFVNSLVYDPETMKGESAYNPRTGQSMDVGETPNVPGSSTAPLDFTGNGNFNTGNGEKSADDSWTVDAWDSSTTGTRALGATDPIVSRVGQ